MLHFLFGQKEMALDLVGKAIAANSLRDNFMFGWTSASAEQHAATAHIEQNPKGHPFPDDVTETCHPKNSSLRHAWKETW